MKIKIEKIVHNGLGLGRVNNKTIFVPYTLPDEYVEVEIIEDKKSYATGVLNNIIKKSPKRIKPICKYFTRCGGCDFLHIPYDEQINIKKEILKYFLNKINIDDNNIEFITSPETFNYRNSVKFRILNNMPSFYQKHSYNFVNIDYCFLLKENINNFIKNLKLDKYFEYLIIKSDNKDRISTNIYSKGKKNRISFEIDELKIYYDYRVFFQVNESIIPLWLGTIKDFIQDMPKKRIVELYSGVGIISLYLSSKFKEIKKITGVEIDNLAVNFAKINREKNKLLNTHFISGKVNKVLNNFKESHINILILDPPREGVDKLSRNKIIKLRPDTIIYSSCEISTFIRDAQFFIENGYSLIDIKGIDMFPQTYHFEIVAKFSL